MIDLPETVSWRRIVWAALESEELASRNETCESFITSQASNGSKKLD